MLHPLAKCFLALILPWVANSCIPLPIGLGLQNRRVLMVNRPEHSSAPSLRSWHDSGPVHLVLVNGMANHPFGLSSGGKPELLGRSSYRDVAYHLRDWDQFPPKEISAYSEAARNAQFQDFVNSYSKQADLEPDPARQDLFLPLRDSRGRSVSGYLLQRHYLHRESRNPVTFHIVCWSLRAAAEKERIYGTWDGRHEGDLSDHKLDRYRSPVNRNLRAAVVTWGLTDASLYRGPEGSEYEWCVGSALDKISGDLGDSHRLALVTASLGSTIAYNTIDKMLRDDHVANDKPSLTGNAAVREEKQKSFARLFRPDPAAAAADQTRIAFYMFANQFGLLSAGGGRNDLESLESIAKAAETEAGKTAPIQLVAFTDPDDLLSMPFPSPEQSRYVKAQNIYVTNNSISLHLPVVGKATNPLAAHNAYASNPVVLRAMLEGN